MERYREQEGDEEREKDVKGRWKETKDEMGKSETEINGEREKGGIKMER